MAQEVSQEESRSGSRRIKKWLKKCQEVAQVMRQEYGADPI